MCLPRMAWEKGLKHLVDEGMAAGKVEVLLVVRFDVDRGAELCWWNKVVTSRILEARGWGRSEGWWGNGKHLWCEKVATEQPGWRSKKKQKTTQWQCDGKQQWGGQSYWVSGLNHPIYCICTFTNFHNFATCSNLLKIYCVCRTIIKKAFPENNQYIIL